MAEIKTQYPYIDSDGNKRHNLIKYYAEDKNGNKYVYSSTKKDVVDYVENSVEMKFLEPVYNCEYPEDWFKGIKIKNNGKNKPGDFIKCKITGFIDYDLIGEQI